MNDFCAFLAFLLFTFLMITIGVLLGIKFYQSEIIEFVCENTYNKIMKYYIASTYILKHHLKLQII